MRSHGVSQPLRVALIGWGAIGRTVGSMLSPGIELVAVAVSDAAIERTDLPPTATLIDQPDQLASTAPDVVAEAAGRDSVEAWGRAALSVPADFIVSSVSAFADADLLDSLRELAVTNGRSVHIQPGALAGVDALSAARLIGIDQVEHRMIKPPGAWRGTPAESLCDLDAITEPTSFFSANAADTATAFPKNANVAMTTALAGIGPQATTITLIADPTAATNRHHIVAHGAFGELDVSIANKPLPDNPKTSAMAALNLVRAIENRVATIII